MLNKIYKILYSIFTLIEFLVHSKNFTGKSYHAKTHWNKLAAGYWYNSMYFLISIHFCYNVICCYLFFLNVIKEKIISKYDSFIKILLIQNNSISVSVVKSYIIYQFTFFSL